MPTKSKQHVVIPRDAWEMLSKKYASYEEAIEAATDQVGETGMSAFVVEHVAVVSRSAPPVKVRKV